jgi:hypothetical protein
MFDAQQLILTAVVGLGVGFLSGVFGAGGGFLIVPILNIALRVPVQYAVGAAACQILGPATTSLLARRIAWQELKLPLIVTGGQIVGAFLGAAALEEARHLGNGGAAIVGDRSLDMAELVVMVLYLGILLIIGLFTILESRRGQFREEKAGWLTGYRIPPLCELPEFKGRPVSIPLLSWFGLVIGFFSGLLGIGGAFLLLPGMIYLWGVRTHAAIRASLVMIWIGAIPNTVAHAWHDNIDLGLVSALLIGGTVGARIGSEIGKRWAGPKLRKNFGWLLLATAVMIAYRLGEMLLN